MESNNIITAPEVSDFNTLYSMWQRNHTGSKSYFYKFITTPSLEREEFIRSLGDRVKTLFAGNVAEIVITPGQLVSVDDEAHEKDPIITPEI